MVEAASVSMAEKSVVVHFAAGHVIFAGTSVTASILVRNVSLMNRKRVQNNQ